MTDPVDTDALRRLAQSAEHGWDTETGPSLRAAANEVDRLRIVLTDAPHDTWCASHDWGNDNHPGDARPCDCWKADAALDGT